jgi:hypothetical protein
VLINFRYEWVNVGMLDYNPDTKLFLVKRVNIPNHILEANAKKLLQKSQIDPSGSSTSIAGKRSDKNEASSSGSEGELEEKKTSSSDGEREEGERKEEGEGSSGSEGEAGPASDGEQKASQPQVPKQPVS